ncbi:MAG: MFS transporter [Cyanobacteriota bacterium]|nr:MFS transporter [Cyanobacteriota bacterium]
MKLESEEIFAQPLGEPDAKATEAKPATQLPERGFIPVLKNRRFLVLWSGQIFSQLADKVYLVLTIALIASHFQSENQTISGWVSAIMIAFTIPAVLFGSLAGVYVDRWLKREVLVISNLLRGALVLTLPLLLSISQEGNPILGLPVGFWMLLGITFFVSTLTQFFAPAEQAAIPLIVERESLLPANSLYTTTMMVLLIVGFALGEPLLAVMGQFARSLGFSGDLGRELVVGGAYAIAGLLLLLLKTGETRATLARERSHVLEDIADGLRYLKHNHRVRNALIQLTILFSIFAALAVLAVRLAETIPGLKAEQFGFLLAVGGLGMGCGAFILGHWGQKFRRAQLSLWGALGMSGSLVGLSLSTQNLGSAFIAIALLGLCAALVGIPMQTTIQAETPEEMRGKVFGLQNNAVNVALSLPLALAGAAEAFFGLFWVLLALAAIALAGGLLTWYISRTGAVTLTT